MACALRNEIHLAQALLQNGADKSVKDNQGRNALWFAILFDKVDFVHFLLGKLVLTITTKLARKWLDSEDKTMENLIF